jgi:hypothetical protein
MPPASPLNSAAFDSAASDSPLLIQYANASKNRIHLASSLRCPLTACFVNVLSSSPHRILRAWKMARWPIVLVGERLLGSHYVRRERVLWMPNAWACRQATREYRNRSWVPHSNSYYLLSNAIFITV